MLQLAVAREEVAYLGVIHNGSFDHDFDVQNTLVTELDWVKVLEEEIERVTVQILILEVINNKDA